MILEAGPRSMIFTRMKQPGWRTPLAVAVLVNTQHRDPRGRALADEFKRLVLGAPALLEAASKVCLLERSFHADGRLVLADERIAARGALARAVAAVTQGTPITEDPVIGGTGVLLPEGPFL